MLQSELDLLLKAGTHIIFDFKDMDLITFLVYTVSCNDVYTWFLDNIPSICHYRDSLLQHMCYL